MSVRLSHPARPAPQVRAHVAQTTVVARRAATLTQPELRRDIVAQAAYFRAERRGFEPGHDLEDWLAAEAEVDAALAMGLASAAD